MVNSIGDYVLTSGLSRRHISKKLGISEQYLSFLVNGKRNPGGRLAKRISRITGIPMENLIK